MTSTLDSLGRLKVVLGSGGSGWPFAHILTVSITDPDADYSTVTAAIAGASAGDVILLDAESSSETVTVNKVVNIVSLARGGTIFTNTMTITAAARLYGIKVAIASGTNSKGFVCNSGGVIVLYNCEATTIGSTTSRAIQNDGAGSTQVYGGYYESSGAGTSFEIFVSAGSVILYDTPTLFTSATSGNVAGAFSGSGGGINLTGAIELDFINGAGLDSGVWLIDESLTRKTKYTTLAAAITAAASGDSIKLDTDTYSVSASQNIGVSVTIEGDGPEATIYTTSVSNAAAFDITADSITVVFRNMTIRHTGGGVAATGIFSNNVSVTVVLDNCVLEITSGAGTDSRGLWIESGTWILRNGSKINITSGTSQYGIYNDSAAATVTIGAGCEAGAGTADIYGDQTGSTLKIYGALITHNTINFAGAIERSGNTSFERGRFNPIINGAFQVWQRGTSFAAIANGTYSADRWFYAVVGTAVHTVSRSTDVPTVAQAGQLVPYSFLADCTTADGTIAAGDFTNIQHRIGGYNWVHLAQRQFTVSFWVKATKTGVYCFSVRNSGVDRSYVAEYTINTTDTWEYKTITVLASPSAGTWDYTTGVGAYFTWALSCGSTFQTTANAWQTGNYFGTSNQVNATDDTANDFRLALVKAEPGAIATPFVLQDYQQELNRCLRYAWVLDASSNTATIFNGSKYATANVIVIGSVPVTMRAAPTLTHNITGYTAGAPGTTTVALFDLGTGGFKTIVGALTVSLGAANTQQISIAMDAGTSWSGTAGDLCQLRIGPSVVIVLSAEL